MTFAPSPQQAAAIAAIVRWYRTPNRRQQVFRLFGYAGSGKTTITQYAINALGLNPMSRQGGCAGGVLFAAFTGKAALVMTRKGTPASTIHSLIYRVSEATPEEIARVEKELFDLRFKSGTENSANPSRISEARRAIARINTILHERTTKIRGQEPR